MNDVVIIASGGANIASLAFALERLGCTPTLSADASRIRRASHVILPGVGAAADAMSRLAAAGLVDLIPTLTQPVLGICLGMQLLYESSEEGPARCLGIFEGRVSRFQDMPGLTIPHMGWNQLRPRGASPLLEGIADGAYAYFVHSYRMPVQPETIAVTEYGGEFSAVVSRGNFHAAQFHPERSAATGARLLANFLET
ncbi:MAG: imidazole glycerol phosphate synthase subunit HisH [Gammaproteobacteria bacterium]|nr:imidazole glycerol phosphate synthase subunit HisH [Gammaproteobacteria bacterium]